MLTRRHRFLAEIEQVVPWAQLLDALSTHYNPNAMPGKCRCPLLGLVLILSMFFLQQWYPLSDEALCNFMGIDLSRDSAPYATTQL